MIAAVYARKSTEQSGVSDDQKPAQGQQILRRLIDGRVTFTPLENGTGYRFTGKGSFVKLQGNLPPHKGASPAGFDDLYQSEILGKMRAA